MTPNEARRVALADALKWRTEVRKLRAVIKADGVWKSCQTGIYEELDEARECWRDAIWAVNWSGFYDHHRSAKVRRAA